MIRVIIADDHHVVRQGLRSLLERADDIVVLAEAADGQEAVDQVAQHRPDVLLLDLSMERLNGIQAAEQIRQRGLVTRIVMLSMHSDRHLIQQALHAGVKGYLVKSTMKDELLLAVRAVAKGYSYLSPEISDIVVSDYISDDPRNLSIPRSPLSDLTYREREVLKLVAEGHTNNEMSDLLQVSTKTIQKHRANLMAKLNIHNIAGLTRVAIKYGLVTIE